MRICLNYFFLISLILWSVLANAGDTALSDCRARVDALSEVVGLQVEAGESDNIRQCVEDFLILNEGRYLIPEAKDCGAWSFGCKIKKSWVASYEASDYADLMVESLNEKEALVLEHYNKEYLPLAKRVEISFEKYKETIAVIPQKAPEVQINVASMVPIQSVSDETAQVIEIEGFDALKFIMLEIIGDYIKAEIEEMGIDLNSEERDESMAVEASAIMKELRDCLALGKTDDHIKTCAASFKNNAPYKVGKIVLTYYLDTYFASRFEPKKYREINEKSFENYAACGISYYFNDTIDIKNLKKIKSCSYVSLMDAFTMAVSGIINKFIRVEKNVSDKMIANLLSTCNEPELFDKNNDLRKDQLGEKTPDEFQALLFSCESIVTKGAMMAVGEIQIVSHKSVVAVIPDDVERAAFAKKALDRGIPTCLGMLPNGTLPEKCENIIFSISAEDLFEKVLLEEIEKYKKGYPFLEGVSVKDLVDDGLEAVRLCHGELYKNVGAFVEKSRDEAEVDLARCTRTGIVAALQTPIDKYMSEDLDGNEVLVKYNISFFKEDKDLIKEGFNGCVGKSLSVEKGYSSLLESTESFLTTCILETTKSVVVNSADLILEIELHKIGFTPAEIKKLVKRYSEKEDNALKAIENAETEVEVQSLLLTVDKDIIHDMADDVIRLLIKEKSPVSFTNGDMRELVKEGKRVLFKCIETKEIKDCSKVAEKKVMALGVRMFLPAEAKGAVEKELKPWFTGTAKVKSDKIRRLKLAALFAKRIKTTAGVRLSEKLADMMLDEETPKTVEELKESRAVREFVYEALKSSPSHMTSISHYLIQPKIEEKAGKYGVRDLTTPKMQMALNWMKIKKMPGGKRAMGVFMEHFKKVVVERKAIDMAAIEKEMSGDLLKAYFSYRKLVRKYCGIKNYKKCKPIMADIDTRIK